MKSQYIKKCFKLDFIVKSESIIHCGRYIMICFILNNIGKSESIQLVRPCLLFITVKWWYHKVFVHTQKWFLYFFSAVIVIIVSAKIFGWHKYPNHFTPSIKCWMYHHQLFYYFFKEEVDRNEFEFDASIFYHENNLNEVEIIYQFLKLVSKKLNHSAILCTVLCVK